MIPLTAQLAQLGQTTVQLAKISFTTETGQSLQTELALLTQLVRQGRGFQVAPATIPVGKPFDNAQLLAQESLGGVLEQGQGVIYATGLPWEGGGGGGEPGKLLMVSERAS